MSQKLIQKIKNILSKQELAENSRKTYLNHFLKVKKLSGHKGFSFNFLKDVDRIIELINNSNEKDTSKKMMLASVAAVSKGARGLKKKSREYLRKSIVITKKLNKQYTKNELSIKQKESLITYTELLKKVDNLKEIFNKKSNKTNRKKYIAGLLYIKTDFTPRLEFADMKIIKENQQDNNADNFMLVKSSGIAVILNDYKTKNKYGKIIFKLEDDVENELKKLNIGEQEFVFESNKGGSIRKNKFSEFIKKTFNGITVNGVRIIKESHIQSTQFYQKLSGEQQEKLHNKYFQHSGNMARSAYRKRDLQV